MAKRAVLAGCNYPGTDSQLSGCVNDVLLIRDLLIKRFKFPAANIALLIDEGNDGKSPKPTGKNIRDALRAGVKASKAGDVLYFHFSGHGANDYDKSGDEADGLDEFICAGDMIPITDDYLRKLVAALPEGAKFVMVSDSCHSGTMLDQPASDIRLTGDKGTPDARPGAIRAARAAWPLPTGQKARHLTRDQYIAELQGMYSTPSAYLKEVATMVEGSVLATTPNWKGAVKAATGKAAGGGATKKPASSAKYKDLVLFSGCMDEQTSADAPGIDNGKAYGAFTYAMVKAIKAKKGTISYWDVAKGARDTLAVLSFEQCPTLTCTDEMARQPFICEVFQ